MMVAATMQVVSEEHLHELLSPDLQDSRKLKPASLLDTILCSTKELRMKQYRNPNTK